MEIVIRTMRPNLMCQPLNIAEDFLTASLDPSALRRRWGLPHPLQKFTVSGGVKDNAYADAVLEFVSAGVSAEPGSPMHRAATWFLFHSEQAFFVACSKCGVDAEKLRSHLELCRKLGPDEMSSLLEARERGGQ
jgi:hypothetical protein